MGSIGDSMHPDELKKFQKMVSPLVKKALAEGDGAEIFADLADRDDPKRMADWNGKEFMNRFFRGVTRVQPGIEKVLKSAKIDVIGHVNEGEVSHVVVRMTMSTQGIEVEKLSVLSVKKYEGIPMLMLTGEMKGMAQALKGR